MEFEYDPLKSLSNEEKRGIDFEEAKRLWDDIGMVRFSIDYGGENRWEIISRYGGICWTAIYTMRGNRIRIISVRRSSRKEIRFYDKTNYDR